MDFTQLFGLFDLAAKYKKWINLGLSAAGELQKQNPDVIGVLANVGSVVFPALKDPITLVAATASALFHPRDKGVVWVQDGLNALASKGVITLDAPLVVDGKLGALTKAAVSAYQKVRPPLVIDGWPGIATQKAMGVDLAKV